MAGISNPFFFLATMMTTVKGSISYENVPFLAISDK